jgi:prophage maintenance system killer protein
MSSNDKETLELIRYYKKSWSLLQKFDDGSLGLYKSDVGKNFILGYDEALTAVDELKRELIKRGEASNIFGVQKADEFEGIIRIS